jgi:hypothetical protein
VRGAESRATGDARTTKLKKVRAKRTAVVCPSGLLDARVKLGTCDISERLYNPRAGRAYGY